MPELIPPSAAPRPANDLLLRAARREPVERTPVWLMRQAGRYDPKYEAIRRRCGLQLEELFRNPELAAEITLLPMRLGVDAAILFQDILTPLSALGLSFIFRPGPVLERPIRSAADIDRLPSRFDIHDVLAFVPASIRLANAELEGRFPLLGFAGAPFTLLAFLIAGGSPFESTGEIRRFLREQPTASRRLLDRLTELTIQYLDLQIAAGVHAVQIFESAADLLTRDEYADYCHSCHVRIFERLGGAVPAILFAKECPWLDLMAACGADVLSVGTCVDLHAAQMRHGERVAFQGNVDNRLLWSGPPNAIEAAVHECLRAGGGRGHILNLSHGVLKDTPLDNVRCFIDACHNYGPSASRVTPAS